jgi:hypothetical protein
MSRHDQKPDSKHMTCSSCHDGNCTECVDVLRAVKDLPPICQCKRKNHLGEPRDQQILDPETGTVHAPGLTVDSDGNVEFHAPH